MGNKRYEQIRANPEQWERKKAANRRYHKRQRIKANQEKVLTIRGDFLALYPQWEYFKDFLEPKEVFVIENFFCLIDGLTERPSLSEIGEQLGCTRQGCSFFKDKALKKLDYLMRSPNPDA